jgi:hypothetical protein
MSDTRAAPIVTQYHLVCALFLRVLGVIYLIAFASIGVQIEGLAGADGIVPFADVLASLQAAPGYEKYFKLPVLFWFDASDTALIGAAVAGCVAALMIVMDRWTRPALVLAFALYLSLYHAGGTFMTFQWDGLLLEAGFLAIFLSPHSRLAVWLFYWLLFRLRFMSGLAKLTVQDPSWIGLTALDYYFETQPLPGPLAWYAHHLPEWLLRFGTGATLFVELVVPLMIFLPRRWRFTAAWLTILWQVLIILTSNHNWFNFLTIALCLFLFDDRAVARVLPQGVVTALTRPVHPPGLLHRLSLAGLAVFVVSVSALHFRELITLEPATGRYGQLLDYAETYRVVNKYHVFPTMRTERIELRIEGSRDGETWKPYVFRYKPDDPQRMPFWVIPHQPRLDWRIWFVPQNRLQLPWFHDFLHGLLFGKEPVEALLKTNPFPDEPPRYIRVLAERYRFTTPEERKAGEGWWKIEPLGPFKWMPWLERS